MCRKCYCESEVEVISVNTTFLKQHDPEQFHYIHNVFNSSKEINDNCKTNINSSNLNTLAEFSQKELTSSNNRNYLVKFRKRKTSIGRFLLFHRWYFRRNRMLKPIKIIHDDKLNRNEVNSITEILENNSHEAGNTNILSDQNYTFKEDAKTNVSITNSKETNEDEVAAITCHTSGTKMVNPGLTIWMRNESTGCETSSPLGGEEKSNQDFIKSELKDDAWKKTIERYVLSDSLKSDDSKIDNAKEKNIQPEAQHMKKHMNLLKSDRDSESISSSFKTEVNGAHSFIKSEAVDDFHTNKKLSEIVFPVENCAPKTNIMKINEYVKNETIKIVSFQNRNQKCPISHPKWIPPESPHSLIEERYYHDPWALLVVSIFLNKTSCRLARPYIESFFRRYAIPRDVLKVEPVALEPYFVKLGLVRTRATQVWRMSHDFVNKEWTAVTELYGIGKYGEDVYRMFHLGDFTVEPKDRFLRIYKAWYQMTENQKKHGTVQENHQICLEDYAVEFDS